MVNKILNLSAYTWLDWGVVIIVIISLIIGIARGFVREACSLATWILSFWVGLTFYPVLIPYFAKHITTPALRVVSSFLILFIATLIIGTLVSNIIAKTVKITGLTGTDKTLGAVFGFARGIILVSALILFAGFTHAARQHWFERSVYVNQLKPVVNWLRGFIPEKERKATNHSNQ